MNRRSAAAVAANPNLYPPSDDTVTTPAPPPRRPAGGNLVHESEIQRQYVRARVPGVLEVTTAQGNAHRFRLHDLSGGGLAF